MKRSILSAALAAALVLTSGLAFAHKGQGGPKGPKASTVPKSHGKRAAAATAAVTKTKGADRGRTIATTTKATGTTLRLSPVQQKLLKNTNLASKLERRLGTANVIAAAAGFRNLGQFVAAVNVSNNLGISFAALKTRMVDEGMSLGQAIQAERNKVDVTTEVVRAERDARIVIDDAEEAMKKKDAKAPKAKTRDGR